jgi:hypothetical protein
MSYELPYDAFIVDSFKKSGVRQVDLSEVNFEENDSFPFI